MASLPPLNTREILERRWIFQSPTKNPQELSFYKWSDLLRLEGVQSPDRAPGRRVTQNVGWRRLPYSDHLTCQPAYFVADAAGASMYLVRMSTYDALVHAAAAPRAGTPDIRQLAEDGFRRDWEHVLRAMEWAAENAYGDPEQMVQAWALLTSRGERFGVATHNFSGDEGRGGIRLRFVKGYPQETYGRLAVAGLTHAGPGLGFQTLEILQDGTTRDQEAIRYAYSPVDPPDLPDDIVVIGLDETRLIRPRAGRGVRVNPMKLAVGSDDVRKIKEQLSAFAEGRRITGRRERQQRIEASEPVATYTWRSPNDDFGPTAIREIIRTVEPAVHNVACTELNQLLKKRERPVRPATGYHVSGWNMTVQLRTAATPERLLQGSADFVEARKANYESRGSTALPEPPPDDHVADVATWLINTDNYELDRIFRKEAAGPLRTQPFFVYDDNDDLICIGKISFSEAEPTRGQLDLLWATDNAILGPPLHVAATMLARDLGMQQLQAIDFDYTSADPDLVRWARPGFELANPFGVFVAKPGDVDSVLGKEFTGRVLEDPWLVVDDTQYWRPDAVHEIEAVIREIGDLN